MISDFKYNIGDTLRIKMPTIAVEPPFNHDRIYAKHLRVVYRFWNGKERIYLVEAQDGVGVCLLEKDAMMETKAMILHDAIQTTSNGRRIRLCIASFLLRIARAVRGGKKKLLSV